MFLCLFGAESYQDQQGGILVVQGSEDAMMAAARENNALIALQGYTIVKHLPLWLVVSHTHKRIIKIMLLK